MSNGHLASRKLRILHIAVIKLVLFQLRLTAIEGMPRLGQRYLYQIVVLRMQACNWVQKPSRQNELVFPKFDPAKRFEQYLALLRIITSQHLSSNLVTSLEYLLRDELPASSDLNTLDVDERDLLQAIQLGGDGTCVRVWAAIKVTFLDGEAWIRIKKFDSSNKVRKVLKTLTAKYLGAGMSDKRIIRADAIINLSTGAKFETPKTLSFSKYESMIFEAYTSKAEDGYPFSQKQLLERLIARMSSWRLHLGIAYSIRNKHSIDIRP